eukprot:Hpha_TRINITY_DN15318_c5_g1::TRINITY_DN15318_c5_g1_i1::g.89841::m.89841
MMRGFDVVPLSPKGTACKLNLSTATTRSVSSAAAAAPPRVASRSRSASPSLRSLRAQVHRRATQIDAHNHRLAALELMLQLPKSEGPSPVPSPPPAPSGRVEWQPSSPAGSLPRERVARSPMATALSRSVSGSLKPEHAEAQGEVGGEQAAGEGSAEAERRRVGERLELVYEQRLADAELTNTRLRRQLADSEAELQSTSIRAEALERLLDEEREKWAGERRALEAEVGALKGAADAGEVRMLRRELAAAVSQLRQQHPPNHFQPEPSLAAPRPSLQFDHPAAPTRGGAPLTPAMAEACLFGRGHTSARWR